MKRNDRHFRVQEGVIHVYFRGNNQHNVFYDDTDKIVFLKLCNKMAARYDTRILEFALMNNHVHLLAETKNITQFMKALLVSYVQWYNRRKGSRDKLFATPFNSACKFTEQGIISCMLYILQNPLNACICTNLSDYKWYSYSYHYRSKSPLEEYISLDTSFLDNYFQTKYYLDKSIFGERVKEGDLEKCETGKSPRISNEELIRLSAEFLNGKNMFKLNNEEITELVKYLHLETNATYKQLASVTQEHYNIVRKICKCHSKM